MDTNPNETINTPPTSETEQTAQSTEHNPTPDTATQPPGSSAPESVVTKCKNKIRATWDSGPKGKAICLGIVAILLYLVWPGGDGAKALIAKAEKQAKADLNVSFYGFYTGMPKEDAEILAKHYRLKEGELEFKENPETHELYEIHLSPIGLSRIIGGVTFDDQLRAVSESVGNLKYIEGLGGYIFTTVGEVLVTLKKTGKTPNLGLWFIDAPRQHTASKAAEAVAERHAAEVWATLGEGKKAGATKTVKLPGGEKMEFVWCPPGTFVMGSDASGEKVSQPQHQVTLTKGFWMARTEVTQKQWESVMGTTLQDQWQKDPHSEDKLRGQGDNLPMHWITRSEAVEFCKTAGMTLPTEAQWEYACRAGTTGAYSGTGNVEEMGWVGEGKGAGVHPVGKKKANDWGLFDMHGNVAEYCADGFDDYPNWAVVDPMVKGKELDGVIMQITRGGNVDSQKIGEAGWTSTSSARGVSFGDLRFGFVGFRPIVCPPK